MFSVLVPDLPGSNVRVNLSPSEILRLADRIIANSKAVHDKVASVPLDKVFTNSKLVFHILICEIFRFGSFDCSAGFEMRRFRM